MPMLTEREDVAALQIERLRHGRQQPIGDRLRVRRGAHAVEQDREFVAAQPRQRGFALDARHRVRRAQRRLQPPRQADQQFVAGEMTQAVVDQLEAIDVEEEHREARAAAARAADQAFEAIHEQHAIRQARQRIGAARVHLRPDARQHDREIQRLRHVVVRAEIERVDDVLAAILRGHHDDRQFRHRVRLPHAFQRLDAAHAGHHHVEQHRVDAAAAEHFQRARTALRRQHRIALAGEAARQHVAVHRIVVHQQQGGVCLVHVRLRPSVRIVSVSVIVS